MTVRVTTCRTLTLPGLPVVSLGHSRGEKDALHGAALTGVEEYGEPTLCADGRAGVNGDCGMYSRGAPRADLGAGFANGDGGMVTRGESEIGFDVLALELACDVAL